MPATTINVPARLLPQRTPIELLTIAWRGLAEAESTDSAGQRYATAHLAALRAAAAVLSVRARPVATGRGPRDTSTWALLVRVAPELSEWAGYFAGSATKRSAAEAGIGRVSAHEADDLVLAAGEFIQVVQDKLGLNAQPAMAA
ncbi:hypothetical protein F4553_002786 [Allocatelliglobosispora scoriae]|uniref:SAV-6107-like HEPN domain-containing protein n=1 Tax=Allocatelliglobosispora scoriae TaxID=643052 RepID=A0A841BJY2_9ACTN|nr:SAV_6107 family HEPN domain-containing protein [Allocatelliglobosispora scoriae]MBB5869407.1 hypothetical protein [Allocatelliglobosispora scoriae]